MIQVSAYPTIEWLRTRAADRAAVAPGPGRFNQTPFMFRLASRLREVLASDVKLTRGVWIATPEGELDVSLVLEKDGKRIAVCETARYRLNADLSDALLLVYGRFDALYRLGCDGQTESLHDFVYGLMCQSPDWFSNFGRLSAGRKASAPALCSGGFERGVSGEVFTTPHVHVKRMRLCVASDWVSQFEKALGAGGHSTAA